MRRSTSGIAMPVEFTRDIRKSILEVLADREAGRDSREDDRRDLRRMVQTVAICLLARLRRMGKVDRVVPDLAECLRSRT